MIPWKYSFAPWTTFAENHVQAEREWVRTNSDKMAMLPNCGACWGLTTLLFHAEVKREQLFPPKGELKVSGGG